MPPGHWHSFHCELPSDWRLLGFCVIRFCGLQQPPERNRNKPTFKHYGAPPLTISTFPCCWWENRSVPGFVFFKQDKWERRKGWIHSLDSLCASLSRRSWVCSTFTTEESTPYNNSQQYSSKLSVAPYSLYTGPSKARETKYIIRPTPEV